MRIIRRCLTNHDEFNGLDSQHLALPGEMLMEVYGSAQHPSRYFSLE